MHHVTYSSLKLMLFVKPNESSICHLSNSFPTWTVLNIHPNPRKQSVLVTSDLDCDFQNLIVGIHIFWQWGWQ